jgi:CRP-like cAMP-binding protein
MNGGNNIHSFSKGELFGLKSVLLDTCREMDKIALTSCVCYSISVESLRNIIGKNFRGQLYMIAIKRAFQNSHMLSKFDDPLINQSYPAFNVKNYFQSEVVVKAGSRMKEHIIIIILGSLYKVTFS